MYGLALLAAFAIGIMATVMVNATRKQIAWSRAEQKRVETEALRREIRAEILAAMEPGHEDEVELDPEGEYEDAADNSVGYQPGR
jgi:hypothetical protein